MPLPKTAHVGRSGPALKAGAVPRRWAVLGVGALAVALGLPALRNGFVWDDLSQVLANRWLTSWTHVPTILRSGVWDFEGTGLTNYYRPLMHLTYLALYQAFGPAPWAFHAVNVLANAVAAILVMLLAQAILREEDARISWPAIAAGVLFAANPIHTEPVAWVAALPDVAGTALGLAALLLLVLELRRGAEGRPGALLATGVLYFSGLLFKETLLVLPAAVLAAELLLGPGQPIRWRLTRLLPFAVAAVAYLGIRFAVLGEFAPRFVSHGLGKGHVPVEAPVLFARYLLSLAYPFDLSAYRDVAPAGSWWSVRGLAGLGVALAYLALLCAAVRRSVPVALGLVLLGVGLVPPLATSAITGGRFGERYLYLPSAGAAIALAGVLAVVIARRPGRAATGAALAVVAALGLAGAVATVLRLPVWHDELTLWTDAARKAPRAAIPRYNLGSALMHQGMLAPAEAELGAALALDPEPAIRSGALNDLGRIYEDTGRRDLALPSYREAVEADPRSASARANLGSALAEAGRLEDGLEQLRAAAELRPNEAGIRYNLALILDDLGRRAEAATQLEAAARLAPGDGRIAEALQRLRPAGAR